MSDWFETLAGIQTQVWERLTQAAGESELVSMATVSPENTPEVRTVVLRKTYREVGAMEIYTDLQSDKIESLKFNPYASILLWDADLKLQIRAQCEVRILSGPDVMDRWYDIPDHSKLSYGITPPPGEVIADSEAYQKAPDPAVFAVLVCTVSHVDAVHLGRPHRRACFAVTNRSNKGDWSANWLAP